MKTSEKIRLLTKNHKFVKWGSCLAAFLTLPLVLFGATQGNFFLTTTATLLSGYNIYRYLQFDGMQEIGEEQLKAALELEAEGHDDAYVYRTIARRLEKRLGLRSEE